MMSSMLAYVFRDPYFPVEIANYFMQVINETESVLSFLSSSIRAEYEKIYTFDLQI